MQDSARGNRFFYRSIGLIRLAIFLSFFGLAACNTPSFSDARVPEISLAGISFADVMQDQPDFTIQLRLKNDNDFDIPFERLKFDLKVEGTPFVDGTSDSEFVLPASSEIIVPVRISIGSTELIERLPAVGTGKRLTYRLSGAATIKTWLNKPIIAFDREGALALPGLPVLQSGQALGE